MSSIDDFNQSGNNGGSTSKPSIARNTRDIHDYYGDEEYADSTNCVQYTKIGNNYAPCGTTAKKLKPGAYKIGRLDSGLPVFEPATLRSDDWLSFRDSMIEGVIDEVTRFWKKRQEFKNYGYMQKRGYMLYGPPGTGKTVLVKQIMDRIIKDGGVVFICDNSPGLVSNGLKYFSEIEPDRNIVCTFEDIDSIIDRFGESEILSLLDGEDSVDHVLNIATTNYPEKLDRRIVGRPRRFDQIIKIDYPDEDMRRFYFEHKLKDTTPAEINEWVSETDGFTFAAFTELVISVKCLGNDFRTSVDRLRSLISNEPSSKDCEPGGGKVGFR